MLWNCLLEQLRQLDITFGQFKRSLKTFVSGPWTVASCVWTLRAPNRNLLTYLFTYLTLTLSFEQYLCRRAHNSDVTKLVKICIRRMRILTFKIRRMRMRIDAFILSVWLDWIEHSLTSHSTHFRSFRRRWGDCSISQDCSLSQNPQCVRCSVVCVRPLLITVVCKCIIGPRRL